MLQRERAGLDRFHIDHIVAICDGGGNEDYNLVPACAACNHQRARIDWSDPNNPDASDPNLDGSSDPNPPLPSDSKARAQASFLNPEPSLEVLEKKISPKSPLTLADLEAAFEVFWKIYRRKEDKGHARKVFLRIARAVDPELIIGGIRRYEWNSNPKYWPFAATWLNGERWADERSEDNEDARVLAAVGINSDDNLFDLYGETPTPTHSVRTIQ